MIKSARSSYCKYPDIVEYISHIRQQVCGMILLMLLIDIISKNFGVLSWHYIYLYFVFIALLYYLKKKSYLLSETPSTPV